MFCLFLLLLTRNYVILGQVARNSEPFMRQVFVTGDTSDENHLARQVSDIIPALEHI